MLQNIAVILAFTLSLFGLGLLLSAAARKFRVAPEHPAAELIAKALPQAQCGQCGYAGCAAYAEAVASGAAPINLCTPGGDVTIAALAEIMHLPAAPAPGMKEEERVAVIAAADCIGCAKCAQACPYDAVAGALREPHRVDPAICVGCGKCVAACPKNCVTLAAPEPTPDTWDWIVEPREAGSS